KLQQISCAVLSLDLRQQLFCGRGFQVTTVLNIENLDHAVFNQHRIALRAYTQTTLGQIEFQTESLGESTATVSKETDLAVSLLITRPGTHHEWIIDCNAPDLVHTFGLELISSLNIARSMLFRAGRGESARHSEDCNFLALDCIRDHYLARADCTAFGSHVDIFCKPRVWQLIAYFNRHLDFL